jgi:heat shock protein HslJ
MARMSRSGVVAIALGVLMAGRTTAGEPAAPQLAGTWRAETIMGRPVIDASASTITFEADGRVHGQGGCNRYFGSSTVDGEKLALGQLGATRMACPQALMDQETRFFQALQSAARWTIDEHGLLLIYSSGAAEPSRFAPFEE